MPLSGGRGDQRSAGMVALPGTSSASVERFTDRIRVTPTASSTAGPRGCVAGEPEQQGGELSVPAASVRGMSPDALLRAFWAAMQANDWQQAADHLAPGCLVDWPCSGERIVGRHDFVAVQERYPSNTGRWNFDVHRLVADERTVVSEVTASDGEQSARAVIFSEVEGEHVVRQVEYWPSPYDPLPGRADLTRATDRIP